MVFDFSFQVCLMQLYQLFALANVCFYLNKGKTGPEKAMEVRTRAKTTNYSHTYI